jgi:hypothetical protein
MAEYVTRKQAQDIVDEAARVFAERDVCPVLISERGKQLAISAAVGQTNKEAVFTAILDAFRPSIDRAWDRLNRQGRVRHG